jgi:hypothetical protein
LKAIKWLFWFLLFLVLLLAVDQFFVQVPPIYPAHVAVSRFYQDFRTRLFTLLTSEEQPPGSVKSPEQGNKPQSIEAVIDHQQSKSTDQPARQKSRRYLYSDADGELQFADSIDDVPLKYRAQAEPMGE